MCIRGLSYHVPADKNKLFSLLPPTNKAALLSLIDIPFVSAYSFNDLSLLALYPIQTSQFIREYIKLRRKNSQNAVSE